MSAKSYPMQDFLREGRFIERLRRDKGVFVDAGDTTPEIRRERIRKAIVDCNLSNVRLHGSETYRQAFERFYGEPLQPKLATAGRRA